MTDTARRGPIDRRLLELVPALRIHLYIAAVAATATALAVLLQAESLATGLAALVIDGDVPGGLGRLIFGLAAIAAVRAMAAGATEWSTGRTMTSVRTAVRQLVLEHAAADVDRSDAGLASREAGIVTTGVDQLEPYIRQFLPALMLATTVPLAAGARILFADPLSAILVAVTVPLIPVFMVLIGRMTERRTQRQWAVLQRLGGHFLDVLSGLPTLRLFGRADAQQASVHEVSDRYRSATMGALRIAFLSALALELLATLSVALIAVEIGLRLAGGGLDLQTALVVLLLAPECYLPLRRVGASFHAAQSGLDAANDLAAVLDRPVLPAGTRLPPAGNRIRLRSVHIVRGRRVVIDGLDGDVAGGEILALSGPSGAGKTSLLDAIRGRLDQRHGHIDVGGDEEWSDVATLDAGAWADRLAVISQSIEPLGATVADDVRAGGTATADDVLRVLDELDLAGLAHQRTDTLSGGQLRRVEVARAALAVRTGRADILVADEPTAHLDDERSDLVWTLLRRLADEHRCSVIVASHDPRCRLVADRTISFVAGSPADRSLQSVGHPAPSAAWQPDVRIELGAPDEPVDARSAARLVQPPTPATGWMALRRVLAMARPVRGRFVGAAALGAAAEICTLGLAGVAAWLIVKAAEQPDLADLALAVVAVRAFGVGKGVLRYGERLATHDAGLRSLGEIRAAVVGRLAHIAPAGVPGWDRGDLLQRVVDDVDRLLDLFVRVLGPLLSIAVAVTAALAVTTLLDPRAGAVLATACFLVGIVLPLATIGTERSVGKSLAGARAEVADRVLATTERLEQLLAHRLLAAARLDADRAADRLDRYERRRTRRRILAGAIVAAAPLLTTTAMIAILGPAAPTIAGPVLGVLVLWPLAIVELVGSVEESAATVPGISAAAQRIVEVIDTPDPFPSATASSPASPDAPIVLDRLVARWPGADRDALGPVDLIAAPGTNVAVTGPSGSGKSTLAAVLVGFCAPREGHYSLGDVSVFDIDGTNLRDRVTWIQQFPWIADSTVRENLLIADRNASDERLVEALRAVQLGDWYERLSTGLDARVGRGGSTMSGGERQRLALARALLADQRSIVLDEPTAHLDRDTADVVMGAVAVRTAERTVMVLGHGDVTARLEAAHHRTD